MANRWHERALLNEQAARYGYYSACVLGMIGFLHLNWGNTLVTIEAFSWGIGEWFGHEALLTSVERDVALTSIVQTIAIAIYTIGSSFLLILALSFLSNGILKSRRDAIRFMRDQRRRTKYLLKNALLSDEIIKLQAERARDRKLIAEMREAMTETRLELESLQIGRTARRRPKITPPEQGDLLLPKHRPTPQKKRKRRFVPNFVNSDKPPVF